MKQMTRRERILAALARRPVDRVPYAVWRHFPAVDRSPAGLAQSTLRFHERYGPDFLKITPSGGYAVQAWGCVEGAEVRPDGHRPCATCAVRDAGDWRKIRALDPGSADGYTQHLETIVRMGFDRRIGVGEAAGVPAPAEYRFTTMAYDSADNLRSVTTGQAYERPHVVRHVYAYDGHSRRTVAVEADNWVRDRRVTTMVYDPADNVVEVLGPRGQRTRSDYDPLDRATRVVEAADTPDARATSSTDRCSM